MQNITTTKTYAIVNAIINTLNANAHMADDINALYADCDALRAAQRTADNLGYYDVADELSWYLLNTRSQIRRLLA